MIKFNLIIYRHRDLDVKSLKHIGNDFESDLAIRRDAFDKYIEDNNIEFERDDISFEKDCLLSILQLRLVTKTLYVWLHLYLI